ncbi:MAG: MFS transporter [Acidimicrobiales bacterium]|nr:MFS transporter [Acidimicrobiales bacterium]MCB1016048.1 MFS transporter [Acidimicrobiales bacterium]MCB9374128.1 MFS transporter [Microthrixaceae bacterium]
MSRRSNRDEDLALTVEDAEDAFVDADRTIRPGTARAALRHRDFRNLYAGAFTSNIGSWMQNAALGAYAFELTRSATFVGIIAFANLGPLLLFSMIGGALADQFDRRTLLIVVTIEQMIFAVALAWLTTDPDPSRLTLVLFVLAIGAAQAVYGPTYSATLPGMVGKEDLAGAISLNSVSMNGSRVIGPAIGGVLYHFVGVSWVFLLNAITYVAVLWVLARIRLPDAVRNPDEPQGLRRIIGGITAARRNRTIKLVLLAMTLFSFFCLPFVVQMPVVAESNFGIEPDSSAYGLLYACLGAGAVAGSLSIGTFLSGYSKRRIVRQGFFGFAVTLTALALLRAESLAYPTTFAVGFFYFATVTSLNTMLQEEVDEAVRGRVMALWIMSFGGVVPIGGLVAGPFIETWGVTALMLVGAVVALAISVWSYFFSSDPGPRRARRLAGA